MTTTYGLPWPPSINGYWRAIAQGGHVRQILSERGREFRQRAAGVVLENPAAYPTQRLAVRICLHAPTRRRYDLDNYGKAILDALEHAGVYADDSQIDDLHITRGEILPGGRAVVTITQKGAHDDA